MAEIEQAEESENKISEDLQKEKNKLQMFLEQREEL